MRVERTPLARRFQPYAILIHIEESRDADLLRGLLAKLEEEVKPHGLYHNIILQIQEAIRSE